MTVHNFPSAPIRKAVRNPWGLPVRQDPIDGTVIDLPTMSGSTLEDRTCTRCEVKFNDGAHYVTDPHNYRPVCRSCAHDNLTLRPWQVLTDIANRLDRLFEPLNREQRQDFLDIVTDRAAWMANWRWANDEHVTYQPHVDLTDEGDETF